ncbi:hypothetical protein [Nocardia tengchongensis]
MAHPWFADPDGVDRQQDLHDSWPLLERALRAAEALHPNVS